MTVTQLLSAAEEPAPAAPWANAFFLLAMFAAVAYFGWNLYQGKQAKDRIEEQHARDAEGADAEVTDDQQSDAERGARDGDDANDERDGGDKDAKRDDN